MRAWNSSSPDCLAAIICRIWPNEVNIESSNSAVDTILISLLLPLLLLPVCEQRFVVNQSALVFCPKQRADLGEGIRPWLAILGRIRWQVNAPDRADRANRATAILARYCPPDKIVCRPACKLQPIIRLSVSIGPSAVRLETA